MIFGLINKDSGPGFHRVMMPLLMMQDVDTYITNAIKPEDIAGDGYSEGGKWLGRPRAIYYSRVVSDEVVKQARAAGCKIVVDIDDYWRLDPHHIAYNDYLQTNFEALQIKHLQGADLVTTTHARLAEKIYPYNKNVVVVPNAIPKHDFFPTHKEPGNRLRIFWQGSITHERDIELLRGPVRRLDKNKYMMVIAGYTKHAAWDRMVAAYTNGLQMPGCILNGLPPHEYYRNYQFADVCLAPLVDTCFNSLKSNLKILEAANMGLPVIASHVHPYIGMDGICYVHRQRDWMEWIRALENEQTRQIIGSQLKEFCDLHYNYDVINQKRKECFV